VLSGQPDEPTYAASTTAALEIIRAAGKTLVFAEEELYHKRGDYASLGRGLHYGQGHKKPSPLTGHGRESVLDKLLANEHIRCISLFASSEY